MTTRKSTILGPDGKPFEVALLSQEIATPTRWGARSVHVDAVAPGLTPERLGAVLREAAMGETRAYLTLAIEMEERYLHYASQLQTRRLAFDAIPASVVAPAGVPAKIVEAVERLIDEPEFRDAASDMTDAIAKGYAVVEPLWEYQEGALKPVAYKHRDPRFFRFDELSLSELRLITDGLFTGEPLPEGKFLQHMPRIRTGLPIRRGLARTAAWAFIIQSFTLQDWAAFAEIYGVPLRVGTYHPTATEEDRRSLLRAVRDIANDAGAIIPKGMELQFHAVSGSHGEAVFGELLQYIDRQISKLVVGQTMTADDGSSLGQAKIHNEVRLDILRPDCRAMAATLNRDLIRWFVAVNFGPQTAYPRVEFLVSEPEDIKALADGVARLMPFGFRVKQGELREKLGLSDPSADDELLVPQVEPAAVAPEPPAPEQPGSRRRSPPGAALAAAGPSCGCPSCLARLAADPSDPSETPGLDALDAVEADMLSDWAEITDPLLEQLFALASEAGSYEEVLARLDELRLDTGPLTERLARATAIARGLGDVQD